VRLIVYSGGDVAGSSICDIIVEDYGFRDSGGLFGDNVVYELGDILLFGVDGQIREVDFLPFDPSVCVVASRHKSESGRATLTCHPTGNFLAADMGGLPGRLQATSAPVLSGILENLRAFGGQRCPDYAVSFEVTHHGPTELSFPLVYAEVGGDECHWGDLEACGVVAQSIMKALNADNAYGGVGVGFGGPHYAPNLSRVVGDFCLGHMMPKYATDSLCLDMVSQMVEKTAPTPEYAIADWKGLRGAEKKILSDISGSLGLELVKTGDIT
jgi:D-aminoacyl-tRNA deacylase